MSDNSSRRRFLQTAAAGAALPLAVVPAVADAADPPASADQSLAEIVRQRYRYLTEDQLKAVQTSLQRGVAAGEVLRRVRLDPGSEPATIFVSDLAE